MVLLMVGAVFGLYRYLRFHQKLYNQRDSPQPKEVPAPDLDPWEKEWLENLRNKHQVKVIEESKLVFKFGNAETKQQPKDGFTVVCICGHRNSHGLTLSMAKQSYERHLKKEGERAIAAIGRFEMPKGISWSAEVERRMN